MTTDAERIFVDSNLFLAATDPSRDKHGESRAFIHEAEHGEFRLFGSGQVLREYAVVATRPQEVNGLGLGVQVVLENLVAFREVLSILPETLESVLNLEALIRAYDLKGKRIQDANLVAVMRAHGLRTIKTWNPGNFRCFEGIDCL